MLWFHSGKYVIKALELKKRYAPLTPKQQEIYDHRFDETDDDDEISVSGISSRAAAGSAQAVDSIVEDTERSIAQEVAAVAKRCQTRQPRKL